MSSFHKDGLMKQEPLEDTGLRDKAALRPAPRQVCLLGRGNWDCNSQTLCSELIPLNFKACYYFTAM